LFEVREAQHNTFSIVVSSELCSFGSSVFESLQTTFLQPVVIFD
jgi:hypothetical protein